MYGVRKPLYRDTIPAGLTDRRWFKYHSSDSVLPRRWRMSLRRSSVFLISFFSHPSLPLSCLLYVETTGRSGWTTLSRALLDPSFFSAHRRRVNRTPRRILPTFRRHFVNVPRMSTASSGQKWFARLHRWLMDERKKRQSGFDFISRNE